jgi:hypothetical protein
LSSSFFASQDQASDSSSEIHHIHSIQNIYKAHCYHSYSAQNERPENDSFAEQAARATYNWANHFVARHNLCPWAERSVQTSNAIHIIVLSASNSLEQQLHAISQTFQDCIQKEQLDPNTAIVFCVIAPTKEETNKDDWMSDFATFYDWYLVKEDDWFELGDRDPTHPANFVTWAPFHPEWEFASETNSDDEAPESEQSIEKQSPFPTISLVSTQTIERAGEATTNKIFESNAQTLAAKSLAQWKQLYQQAVFSDDELK